jgi:hypothetical protein
VKGIAFMNNSIVPFYTITLSLLNANESDLGMFMNYLELKISEFILEMNLSGLECEAQIKYHSRMKLTETYQINFYRKQHETEEVNKSII